MKDLNSLTNFFNLSKENRMAHMAPEAPKGPEQAPKGPKQKAEKVDAESLDASKKRVKDAGDKTIDSMLKKTSKRPRSGPSDKMLEKALGKDYMRFQEKKEAGKSDKQVRLEMRYEDQGLSPKYAEMYAKEDIAAQARMAKKNKKRAKKTRLAGRNRPPRPRN